MTAFERLASIVKKHPWAVIAVCLLVTAGLGFGLFFLKGHVTYQSLLPAEFPSVKALGTLNSRFGGIAYEYVLLKAPSVTDNDVVQALVVLEEAVMEDPRLNSGQVQVMTDASGKEVPVIQSYITPFMATMKRELASRGFDVPLSMLTSDMVKQFTGMDYKGVIEKEYLSNPQASEQVVGRFITEDRKAALVMLKIGADLTEKQQVKLGGDLEDFFDEYFGSIPGVTVTISGDTTLARDFQRHIRNKTALLFLIAILFVLVTIFLAFRRFSDTVLPLLVMLLAMVCTFGFTGWVGIQYTVAVIAVMPLLLGAALTFVVPYVARYYEEGESCDCSVDATSTALMAVGTALFLAAVTNAFGFLVFQFSALPALKDFGLTCAAGSIFVFALSVTMLPSVIIIRDRALERGGREARLKRAKYFDGLSLRKHTGIFTRAIDRALGAFTGMAVGHSTVVIIVFGVLILAGFAQLRGLTTDSDLRKLVPRSLPGMNANFEVEKYFGGRQQDVVMVTGDVLSPKALEAMKRFEDAVASRKGPAGGELYTRSGIMSLADALTAANNGRLPASTEEAKAALKTAEDNGGYITGGLLSADRETALVTLDASGAASTGIVNAKIGVLREEGKKHLRAAGLNFTLGGITPLTRDMTRNIIPTETLSSIISLAFCALILIVIFRSFPYGLVTLTVALAGVAAQIGFLAIVEWPLDIMTSLVSALVIGVGVNFGILFTHRYIQEMRRGERLPAEAIRATMRNLGRANVIAAVATVGAFVIVMFSGIVPLRRFGGVTAVAISVCLVTSLTLMPALLYRLSGREQAREESELLEVEGEPQST